MGCTGSFRSSSDVKGIAKETFLSQQDLCSSMFVNCIRLLAHLVSVLLRSKKAYITWNSQDLRRDTRRFCGPRFTGHHASRFHIIHASASEVAWLTCAGSGSSSPPRLGRQVKNCWSTLAAAPREPVPGCLLRARASEAVVERLLARVHTRPRRSCWCPHSRTGGSATTGLGLLLGREGLQGAAELLVLEVEDEADKWSPPCSERSCGTRLS